MKDEGHDIHTKNSEEAELKNMMEAENEQTSAQVADSQTVTEASVPLLLVGSVMHAQCPFATLASGPQDGARGNMETWEMARAGQLRGSWSQFVFSFDGVKQSNQQQRDPVDVPLVTFDTDI